MVDYLDDLVTEERWPRSDLEKLKVDKPKIAAGVVIGAVTGGLAYGVDQAAGFGILNYISNIAHAAAESAGYGIIGLGAFNPYLQAFAAGAGVAGGLRFSGSSMIVAGIAAAPAVKDFATVGFYYGWGTAVGSLTGSLLGILGIYGAFWAATRILRNIFKKKRKK